ncbi:hypothetical protein ACFVHB_37670 [Kitasatospora sp. NPDC127111]|uniref:hypothetical protein n=1 Tax=Kitasatospora sp. NPDC127111 TaxID=3345363 RepID=UPI003627C28C
MSRLVHPVDTVTSTVRRVPGAGAVSGVLDGALNTVGLVSPRARRIAAYTGAGLLGALGAVDWPVAAAGAAAVWLTQARPGGGRGQASPARPGGPAAEPADRASGSSKTAKASGSRTASRPEKASRSPSSSRPTTRGTTTRKNKGRTAPSSGSTGRRAA